MYSWFVQPLVLQAWRWSKALKQDPIKVRWSCVYMIQSKPLIDSSHQGKEQLAAIVVWEQEGLE